MKFESVEDRNAIFDFGFTWEEKFPLMFKTWHKDFNPLMESFNKFPLWVRLLNLPLYLWEDSILEEVGKALSVFIMTNIAISNVFWMMYACSMVEFDITKGIPKMILLDFPLGSWNVLFDYEGIPFYYRKFHLTSHLVARCSSSKSRLKMSPSWWKWVSDDHYTFQKVPSLGNGDSPQNTLVADSTIIFDRPFSPSILMKDSPVAPSIVVASLSLDSIVLVSSVDFVVVFVSPSPPLAPSVVETGLPLDFSIPITSMDSTTISICLSTPTILMVDQLLAPFVVVPNLSLDSCIPFSSVSKVFSPMVPFLAVVVPS